MASKKKNWWVQMCFLERNEILCRDIDEKPESKHVESVG